MAGITSESDIDVDDPSGFESEVRAFLDAHAQRRPSGGERIWGTGDDRVSFFSNESEEEEIRLISAAKTWQRTRYDNGWGWITGPKEFGGRELSPTHQMIYDAVESKYDVPDTSQLSVVGLGLIGPTISAHAQQPTRERYLPAMYRGDIIACQLFSEPAAGSDLAAVETRATRSGDGWLLNGQKVWTSAAQHSQIGEALCRTDTSVPKHRGMTAFIVDMTAPGVEVRPLKQMTGGSEFNEVFLNDVFVPDDHRLGEVNGGWTVALTTLLNERDVVGGSSTESVTRALTPDSLAALMRATWTWDDRALRRDLSEFLAESMAVAALNEQSARTLAVGGTPGAERSVAKLMQGRNLTRAAHFVSNILGPRMIADTGEWGTFAWSQLLLASPAMRILGGTEEIMKNILAEQVLGLPKDPTIDNSRPFKDIARSGATDGVSK
ncbi:acyl-CoA dehydrogenase (plasmid) [Rhodococcus sp. BH4]|jgi:acyl-CoA dehydrogenase|uniref:acyl-CoA dehydrogenase family protein n=1 Tax=Rhodococcus sp. BH4 TaxID=1807790 RepID=UPI0009C30DBC|nr:acyl-CoA dehydrogenase family protein [Rhodococcus sp. BH4]ARE37762.1 acyl-CoA dehydrogenase [Rhodococcus sp. BH4]